MGHFLSIMVLKLFRIIKSPLASMVLFFIFYLPLQALQAIPIGDNLLTGGIDRGSIETALKKGDYFQAFSLLEKSQEFKGVNLEDLKEQVRLIDRVEPLLDQNLEKNPNNPYSHRIKGKILLLKNELGRALKSAEKALSLKRDRHHLNLKGWIEYRSGKISQAVKTFEKGVLLYPGDEKIYANFRFSFLASKGVQPTPAENSELRIEPPPYIPSRTSLYLFENLEKIPFRDVTGEEDLEKNLQKINVVLYNEKKEREKEEEKNQIALKNRPKPQSDENSPENFLDQGELFQFSGENLIPWGLEDTYKAGDEAYGGKGNLLGLLEYEIGLFKESCELQGDNYQIFENIEAIYQRIIKLDPDFAYLLTKRPDLVNDVQEKYQIARATFQQGELLRGAVEIFESGQAGRFKRIIPDLTEVLKFSSAQFGEAFFYLGICHFETEDYPSAISSLETLLKKKEFIEVKYLKKLPDEKRIRTYKTLIESYRKMENFIGGFETLEKMKIQFPGSAESVPDQWKLNGQYWVQKYPILVGLLASLLGLLVLFFILVPLATWLFQTLFKNPLKRMGVSMAQGDYSAALLIGEKLLLNKKPGDPLSLPIIEKVVECSYKVGHLDRTKDLALQNLQFFPENYQLGKFLAKTYHLTRAHGVDTLPIFKNYLEHEESQDPEVLTFAVPLLIQNYTTSEILPILEKYFRVVRDNPEVNLQLGEHYLENKIFTKDSLKIFQSVLEVNSEDLDLKLATLHCYEILGFNSEIVREGKELLKSHPDNLSLCLQVINGYKGLNMLEEAVLFFEELNQLHPGRKGLVEIHNSLKMEMENVESKYLERVEEGHEVLDPGEFFIDEGFLIPSGPPKLEKGYLFLEDKVKWKPFEEPLVIEDPFFEEIHLPIAENPQLREEKLETPLFEEEIGDPLLLDGSLDETHGKELFPEGDDLFPEFLPPPPLEFDLEDVESIGFLKGSNEKKGGEIPLTENKIPPRKETIPEFLKNTPDFSFSDEELPLLPEEDLAFLDTIEDPLRGDQGTKGEEESEMKKVESMVFKGFFEKALEQINWHLEQGSKVSQWKVLKLGCLIPLKREEEAGNIFGEIQWKPILSEVKTKHLLYDLGVLLEERGKTSNSLKVYNEILSIDIGFKDTFDRYEKLLGKVG